MMSEAVTQIDEKFFAGDGGVPLSAGVLRREDRAFEGRGGVSRENRRAGFRPAFCDTATNRIYLSRYGDGRPAPCHLLEGLPEEVVVERDPGGRVCAAKSTLVAGFIRDGLFYSRAQAAQLTVGQAGWE